MKTPTMLTPLGETPFRGSAAIAGGHLTKSMLRASTWRSLLPDVYIRSARYAPDDHLMWCEAARLIMPRGAVLGGWSAALLWGTSVLPRDARVWISMPIASRMRRRHRLRYQRTPLPETDRAQVRQFAVTTPVRTAFDLGRYLPRVEALITLDAMCRQLIALRDLQALASDRWSWPRSRQLEELLPLVEPRSESPMETRTRLLLHDAGVAAPVPQYEVRAADGSWIGRVDLAYPQWRIAIEYEGDHHRERDQFRRDIARSNALREAGWLLLRFTADDILRCPDNTVRQVLAAIKERS